MGSSLGFYEGRKGDRQTPTASHSAMLVIDGASACQRPGDEDSHGANGGTGARATELIATSTCPGQTVKHDVVHSPPRPRCFKNNTI